MVTRCVCFNQTFAALKKIARQKNVHRFSELWHHVNFGRNCGRCRPYVNRMLTTGETVFAVMNESEVAGWEPLD